MPKIPRDISGKDLAKFLSKYDYEIVRETGSHIRLSSSFKNAEHKITLPDHAAIKIGTLNNILNDIANYLELSKQDLVKELIQVRNSK